MPDAKTIQVRSSTKRQLDRLGTKGDTYDTIIRKLILFFERHGDLNDTSEKPLKQVEATRNQAPITSPQ